MRRAKYGILLGVLAVTMSLLACDNAFRSLGDRDSREARLEEARIAMDRGDFTTAVAILEALSASGPDDPEVRRALASAYSGRAGLDFLEMAARAATAMDNASASTVAELARMLPHTVTDNNLADIAASITTWQSIASGSGSANDYFSLALAQATQGLLVILKDTDTDHDGMPDAFSQAAIPDGDALLIYGALDNAIANLGPGRAGLDIDSDVMDSIAEIKAGIDNVSPGAVTAADIRSYLQSQDWN